MCQLFTSNQSNGTDRLHAVQKALYNYKALSFNNFIGYCDTRYVFHVNLIGFKLGALKKFVMFEDIIVCHDMYMLDNIAFSIFGDATKRNTLFECYTNFNAVPS